MIIFVYGDDGRRVQEKLGELRKRFLDKFDPSGMNLVDFPTPGTSTIDLAEALQAVQSMPFLSEKRMVVLRGLLSSKKAEAKAWVAALEHVPDSTIAVFVDAIEAKAAEKHDIFSALQSGAEAHAYAQAKLEGAALTKWIVERVQKLGGKISSAVAGDLAGRVGGDEWKLQNEIEKLVAYAAGRDIDTAMLDQLVSRDTASQIFALADAAAAGEKAKALKLLEDERNAGSADMYIFAMLARQVRILLQVRTLLEEQSKADKSAVASALKLHPFVAQKALAQARRYSSQRVYDLHSRVLDLDAETKRGRLDPALAVDLLVAELLK